MHSPIKLIVGLGNPGSQYASTRHNAGVWFVERLLFPLPVELQPEHKFLGRYAKVTLEGQECYLLIPTTFMNHCGQSVKALAQFFKLPTTSLLIVHDDLDLPCGTLRLKQGGGHGGHNGLRDIIAHLGSNDFYRLRIGIDHPGTRSAVVDYVLNKPSVADKQLIMNGIDNVIPLMADIMNGHFSRAMQTLHSQ